MGIFRRKKEKWFCYNAGKSEFPNEEVMKKCKAIVIPGSCSSAYDDKYWIKKFREWIRYV
jgi:GMP synthase-like glutamine amidotransferase